MVPERLYQEAGSRYLLDLGVQGGDTLISSFPLLLAFDVGGLGFEFCVFVAGWRHALRSEWPFLIIIMWHLDVLCYEGSRM